MPAIALPWTVPAIGEGLAWGAGALGTGLAALGIIENKDAIKDGISDFGNWVSTGVENGIRAWSDAMSPKGPAGPSPHYDAATGRPIAVADATRVQMPLPVVRSYNILSSYFDEMGKGKNKGKNKGNTAKPTPTQPAPAQPAPAPQPEPAQERTATESTTTAQPTTASGTAAPAPQPERNDSTDQRRPSWRERLGDRIAGRSSGQTSTGGNTPEPQKGPLFKRILWETENNNFGPEWWRWRNAGRLVGVGAGTTRKARDEFWPAVVSPWIEPDTVSEEKPNPTPETPPTTTTEAPIRIYPVAPPDTLTNLLD